MVSPWQSAVAAMIKSGCEKVCPALRPSSTSSRHLNMTSSVTGSGFALFDRLQFVEPLDEQQVGDLFDDRERIGDATRPEVVPCCQFVSGFHRLASRRPNEKIVHHRSFARAET